MLNINKCEILALHEQPACSISNIRVKTEVKYLGITVTRNKEIREKENILRNIDKCKKMLNLWLQRDTTIFVGFCCPRWRIYPELFTQLILIRDFREYD